MYFTRIGICQPTVVGMTPIQAFNLNGDTSTRRSEDVTHSIHFDVYIIYLGIWFK